MIEVKEAVQIAKAKAAEMLNEGPTSLEEIERESYHGRDAWMITLGFYSELVAPRFERRNAP